jgi:hypothetical protein
MNKVAPDLGRLDSMVEVQEVEGFLPMTNLVWSDRNNCRFRFLHVMWLVVAS